MRSTLPVMAGAWLACSLLPFAARADSSAVSDTLEDVKLYFTAPIRWNESDWLAFAGSLAAIGVAHEFDSRVREHFATGPNSGLNGGQDKNSLR
ncbi:MAG TPA: hypothetical protein VGL87_11945, partial [Steroidobacteraceae bacterium]